MNKNSSLLTWNNQWKVSPTNGQPMEPLGSGRRLSLSRVRLQRRLHSCRVSASSRTAERSEVSAVAKADSTPNWGRDNISSALVRFPASTCVCALKLSGLCVKLLPVRLSGILFLFLLFPFFSLVSCKSCPNKNKRSGCVYPPLPQKLLIQLISGESQCKLLLQLVRPKQWRPLRRNMQRWRTRLRSFFPIKTNCRVRLL